MAAVADYRAWNEVVADTFFVPEVAGHRVFMDMADDVLTVIGERRGMPDSEVIPSITRSTVAHLRLDAGKHELFDWFDGEQALWRREVTRLGVAEIDSLRSIPPPTLALMALFVVAAERMGRDPEHRSGAHAYYRHLVDVLGLPQSATERLVESFRHSTEAYWGDLADWLDAMDGRFGHPTANARASARYIGLPVSQAVVRRTERRALHRLFAKSGVGPGQEMTDDELRSLLEMGIKRAHRGGLKRLWADDGLRDYLCQVAAYELSVWDGATDAGQSLGDDVEARLSLVAWSRRDGFRRSIAFGVGRPGGTNDGATWRLEGLDGEKEIATTRLGPTVGFTGDAGGLTGSDVLSGVIRVAMPDGSVWTRRPTAIVVLKEDAVTGVYVETDETSLRSAHIVAVSSAADVAEVEAVLREISDPNFTRSILGDGRWTLFGRVVFDGRRPSRPVRGALAKLVPKVAGQVELVGGIALPGLSACFSTLSPPDVLFDFASERPVRVSVEDESGNEILAKHLMRTDRLVLADTSWTDGDYVVRIDGDTPDDDRRFRLRSAESEPFRAPVTTVCHTTSGRGVLEPTESPEAGDAAVVRGACATSPRSIRRTTAPSPTPSWAFRSRCASTGGVRLPSTDQECFVTGAHRFSITGGAHEPQVHLCQRCGYRKVTAYQSWRRSTPDPTRRVHRTHLASPEPSRPSVGPGLREVCDSMTYLGSGSLPDVRVLLAAAPSLGVRADEFVADLSALAFLDVSATMNRWIVQPPTLVRAGGSILLTGGWRPTDLRRLTDWLERDVEWPTDGKLGTPRIDGRRIEDLPPSSELLPHVPRVHGGSDLLARLPTITDVVDALPEVPAPSTSAEKFGVRPLGWVAVSDTRTPGLYRWMAGRRRRFGFRRPDGLLVAVTSEAGKHLAGAEAGLELMAYDEQERLLRVPFGARLPGLYDRAAVLRSGRAPWPDREAGAHVYERISPIFAAELKGRLYP